MLANDSRLGLLRLDARSTVPLHIQAEELLRELIQRAEYKQGGLLPDEVSLSKALGVSRNTLRAAIGRLVSEGRLERKAGVGTRVVEPRVQSGVGAWHSFTRELAAKGITAETYATATKWVRASVAVAQTLQVPPETEVLRLDRVRGWNARPEADFRSFFHPRLGLTQDEDFHIPLYDMIRTRTRLVANQSLEELTAVAATQRLARALEVPVGTPLLRRERTVLDTERRPMEYAIVHYRCDRFRLTMNLRPQ